MSYVSLKGQIPLTKLYGVTPDISNLMLYTFYLSVYYASHNQSFPPTSEEKHAFWVSEPLFKVGCQYVGSLASFHS